ncbi:DNA gyrase subunit B, partial [Vibrio parahaemolyticus]|nr:DNA gyrase subunit B [Vibrio parahaemolyticus]
LAMDNAELHVNADAPALAGAPLEKLVQQYNAAIKLIERMSRRYPHSLIHEFIYMPRMTAEKCQDEAGAQAWTQQLIDQLNAKEVGASQYSFTLEHNAEHNVYSPRIKVRTHGVTHEYLLSVDLLNSKEYGKLAELSEAMHGLIEDGAYIKRGERTQPVASFAAALDW